MIRKMSDQTKGLLRSLEVPQLGQYLSPREREALTHIANGYTAAQAAQRMGLSYHTVRGHLSHAYVKLGARNVVHAVAIARALGFVKDADIEIPEGLRKKAA